VQYVLLIYGEENGWASRSEDDLKALYAGYGKLSGELRAQGKLLAADELQPVATATTVQVRKDETIVSDGPFAATKEVLGGYYLIEAGSLDEAIEWAAKIPDAREGKIEIRPIVDHSGTAS
jgi:hypothetical protein